MKYPIHICAVDPAKKKPVWLGMLTSDAEILIPRIKKVHYAKDQRELVVKNLLTNKTY